MILSTVTMVIVGYNLNFVYSEPCCKLPFLITETECRPVFLFALAYLTFEKILSTYLGTRIRGVYYTFQQDSMYSSRYLRDFPLLKIMG